MKFTASTGVLTVNLGLLVVKIKWLSYGDADFVFLTSLVSSTSDLNMEESRVVMGPYHTPTSKMLFNKTVEM